MLYEAINYESYSGRCQLQKDLKWIQKMNGTDLQISFPMPSSGQKDTQSRDRWLTVSTWLPSAQP